MANTGLKCLQWFVRGNQFIASVIIVGIYAYFLAMMASHGITTPTQAKAVAGIAIVGALYALTGIFLVCCCAGHIFTSFIALVIDVGLIAGYIFIAVANKDGAGSCSGGSVSTPLGSGAASATPRGSRNGSVGLTTFGVLCRLESVALAAACIAIFLFVISILLEVCMNRRRTRSQRPSRSTTEADPIMYPGRSAHPPYHHRQSTVPNVDPRYGAFRPPRSNPIRSLWMRGATALNPNAAAAAPPANPDALPMHQQPSQFQTRREPVEEWGEVQSLCSGGSGDELFFNDGSRRRSREDVPVRFGATTAPRPAADVYHDGDEHVEGREYNLYREDERGNDLSEIGTATRGRENNDARLERLSAA